MPSQGFPIILPQRLGDANFDPSDAWLVYTWTATGGTFTTPLTTYSDTALTTPHTNPIVMNASGYFATAGGVTSGAWVAEGTQLDIQVKNSAGVLQYTLLGQQPMSDGYDPAASYDRTDATDSNGTYADATLTSPTITSPTLSSITNSDVKVLAADATATSNATLTSLTGFSWTLVAAGTYAFSVRGKVGMTTNGGLAVALKYTTATLTSIIVNAYQRTASAFALAQSTTTTDQTKFINQKATAYIDVELQGSMVVNAGGTVAVQFAQETSHIDTTTIYKGFVGEFVRTS
jgi:hypothetical protein